MDDSGARGGGGDREPSVDLIARMTAVMDAAGSRREEGREDRDDRQDRVDRQDRDKPLPAGSALEAPPTGLPPPPPRVQEEPPQRVQEEPPPRVQEVQEDRAPTEVKASKEDRKDRVGRHGGGTREGGGGHHGGGRAAVEEGGGMKIKLEIFVVAPHPRVGILHSKPFPTHFHLE